MRRVSKFTANKSVTDGGEEKVTTAAVTDGPRMHSAQTFYRNVAVARFGSLGQEIKGEDYANLLGPKRLYEMVTRVADPKVRDLVNSPTASATPEKLYQGYLALLDKERELLNDKATGAKDDFADVLEWGRELLLELREQRVFLFRHKLQSAVDVISKVGAWEPELLLARELGKHAELGGTDILLSAIGRTYPPKDVLTAMEGQLESIAAVASTVPPPPATAMAARLDETGVVDALLRGDQAYTRAVTALRSAAQLKRTIPASNLNLRGQITNVLMLNEVFGRLGSQLNTPEVTPAVREILLMTARLATSNQVSALAKSAAFRGIDAVLARQYDEAVKAQSRGQSAQVPPYKSMAQLLLATKSRLAAEFTELTNSRRDASQTKIVHDAIDDLIGEIFRQGSNLKFAVESITRAEDPGSILLRTISDTPQRERIVSDAMSAQGSSTGRIALLSDKARRESELRKRFTADNDFRPGLESSALLLSWPSDLPRPPFEPAAAAARAHELKTLGTKHNLKALIEDNKPAKEIYDELLRLSAEARFPVGADDQSKNEIVGKILRGEQEVKGGRFKFKYDHTKLLLESNAIGALEKQMQHGFGPTEVIRSIARAIYMRNGELLNVLPRLLKSTDAQTKVTIEMVVAALSFVHEIKDGNGVVHEVPTVNPGSEDDSGNVVFAYSVLALCKKTLGSMFDKEIDAACQSLLKRTGVISLARYAGLTEKEGLDILTKPYPDGVPPDCAHFIPLLADLKLPPTYLQDIMARSDLGSFPADTLFEIFARCLEDQAVSKEDVVRLAIAGITSRAEFTSELCGTNIWATFNELASRGFDHTVGKRILEGLPQRLEQAKEAMAKDAERRPVDAEYAAAIPVHKPMPPLDAIYRAAAMCAADGKLFRADDVAVAVLALEPAQGDALVREMALHADQFFKALSDGLRTQVMTRALKSMAEVTDASVLDDASSCLKRLGDLQSRGVKLDSDVAKIVESMAECALVRAATNPLEIVSVRGVLDAARDSGVDVDAIATRLLTDPSKAKAAAGMTPNQLLAVRLEAARLVPGTDVALIKAALGGKYAPGPFVAAFDLVVDRDLSADLTKSLCRLAIDWAASDKAFSSVVDFRKRLVDAGRDDRLETFDAAFTEAVKDQPKVWEAVPEARALAAATKLKDLQEEIIGLAAGGKEAEARAVALADRIASVGAFATELVPQVMACLHRAVRAQRPSLDDVQFGLNVPQTPTNATPKAADKAPAVETVDFQGRLQLRKYQGKRGHVDVPPWAEFVATPATIHNMETLDEALASEKPYVIILGPPGPGKTFTARQWAQATGTPMLELNGGPERRNDQFVGYWGVDKRSMPFYERADFLKIYTEGGLAVDDEFQASEAHVLDQHATFASRFNKTLAIRTNKNEIVPRSPDAKVVLIGNFNLKTIPRKLRENARIIYFNQLPLEDQMMIAGKSASNLPEDELKKLSNMQLKVETLVSHLSLKMPLSVRNLKRATQLAERFRDDPSMAAMRAAREMYIDGVSDPQAKALISAAFAGEDQFGIDPATTVRADSDIEIRQALDATVIGEAAVNKGPNPRVDLPNVKHDNNGHKISFYSGGRERRELEFMGKVMEKKWPLLYVAPPGSGVTTIIEAMAQLTGLKAFVWDANAETGANELLGEMTVPDDGDDKSFKTVWEDGFVNKMTKGPGLVVIPDFDKLPRDVQIAMHKPLEERKVPGEKGVMTDMHPDAHIILTASSQEGIGEAVLNRCVIRALEAKDEAEIVERLVGIAQSPSMGVPKDIAEQMVRFDGIWGKMINATIATVVGRDDLPVGGMQTLVTWLAEVGQVIRGEKDVPGDDLTEKVRNAFVRCGAKLYIVPGERKYSLNGDLEMSDDEIVKRVLEALYEGNDDQVKALAKLPDEEPKDPPQ